MNTPRQIYLQRHLGYVTPRYLHVPLARDNSGEKLSKQTRATAIATDSTVPTLRAAWAFLNQRDVGQVASVAQFWKQAILFWNPALMWPPQRGAVAPDNTP